MEAFIRDFKQKLALGLPGEAAQHELAPYERRQRLIARTNQPKLSAVLALFYEKDAAPHVALILRNTYKGVHSAQVGFPGGKTEKEDASMEATALREAHEEIGVEPSLVEVIGELTEIYIPPSGFLVSPFVGYCATTPIFKADPIEVQEIIEAPISAFISPNSIQETTVVLSGGNHKITTPSFKVDGHIIWGATAMMLGELRAILLR